MMTTTSHDERSATFASTLVAARRLRELRLDDVDLADPSWDILLDLYISRQSGRRVSLSSLSIAAAVPAATGLRAIDRLVQAGLLVRIPDPDDGRRTFVELAPETAIRMRGLLGEMHGLLRDSLEL